MKRKIFKTLTIIKRKFELCLILAGIMMINTGFTAQSESPATATNDTLQIEQTHSNEPTAIAVDENGRLTAGEQDELTRILAENVENSLAQGIPESVDEPEEITQATEISTVEVVEERPPENVVETPNGLVPYSQVMTMEATAYLPADGGGSGLTAMGIPATYGIVAVDPAVIPLGTRVYVPGYGEALAADTGGAIYGYRIDLCMESYWQAIDFGRRNVTVFVLK